MNLSDDRDLPDMAPMVAFLNGFCVGAVFGLALMCAVALVAIATMH